MNVRKKTWFIHSNGTSPEGRLLQSIYCNQALSECVGAPTRGIYLLHFLLTDLLGVTTIKVLVRISDH